MVNRCRSLAALRLNGNRAALVFCGLLLLTIAGCNGNVRPLAPVSGRITLDGKPLAGGSVVVQPVAPPGSVIAGKGSVAFCDADGRYQLETIDGKPGAVIGEHRVRIYGPRKQKSTAVDGDTRGAATGDIVPKKYNHNSELMLTVTADGKSDADFKLTSK